MSILSANNINFSYYPSKQILKGINLSIEEGEFAGIIGPNGAGKTTLLKVLSAALKPSEGKVLFNDKDIYSMPLRQIAQNFAFVSSQNPMHFPFKVLEVVLMGRIPHLQNTLTGSYGKKDIRIAMESLRFVDIGHLYDRPVYELSSGELQRVMIAKMLAQKPKVAFLDEPTLHLDIAHQIELLELLRKLNTQQNLTVIIILHDLNLASEYCRKLILLNKGQVENSGTAEEVITYEAIEKAFKTLVLVNKNPLTDKPHVLLITEENKKKVDN